MELKVWPVPAFDRLFIDLSDDFKDGCKLSIIDYTGREVSTYGDLYGPGTVSIDISKLEQGIYFCLIENKMKGIVHNARFIKH